MDSTAGSSGPDPESQPSRPARGSVRDRFESLSLVMQFRIVVTVAVFACLAVMLAAGALWDTRVARKDAIALAQARTSAMAARLEAAGGGALDRLDAHPHILAATFRLENGDVLERYVREDVAQDLATRPVAALAWNSPPSGLWHKTLAYLSLEPIYVESPVQLNPSLSGTVSVLIDPRWIRAHWNDSLGLAPLALLLAGIAAWFAAGLLRRQVADPLAQLVRSTHPQQESDSSKAAGRRRFGNELVELAANFEFLSRELERYERDLTNLRHSTAQQIADRTRELETRTRKAELLAKSKDEFLANMSHEIRTPMNGVLGMAELLAGTEMDKRQRRFLDSMRAAAETMMKIINDILDDAKIEAGKMDLVLEPFDVRELAEQACQLYAGQAESKKLEMICRIEPVVPRVVVGDMLRLRQVLGNLLSNAVKYTDQGEIEIRVGLDDLRDGQSRLHFSVRDTGPGIPDPEQSGIFEAFTQLESAARMGGTGLGLTIATRLVQLMGGQRIDLSSAVGRGSTFSFVLPFEVREAAPVPDRASDEFSGLRVLVVDDSSTSYMLLEEMLTNWSADVTVLNRGALVGDRMHDVATRGKRFDLVLLDHSLPDATTAELLRTIRLDPVIADTYVVLLSALDFNPSYEGTKAIAPDTCIAKPVRAQLLRGALQASREPRKAAPPPPPETDEPGPRRERVQESALDLHVLVADDNAINCAVAVAMLEEFGARVTVAEDGNAAVELALNERFDAILMDCQMPGKDGYAATEQIRRHEAEHGLARTTIIALTANVLARDRERCLAVGMDAFLAKPFKAAELAEVLSPVVAACEARTVDGSTDDAGNADSAQDPTESAAETVEPVLGEHQVQALLTSPVAATGQTARLPVLDLEQVQSIQGLGKPQVFEQLCEMLFASSREAFARLDKALASGDLEEIAAAAHAFKSPVNNLGGRRLAGLLERCETAALEGRDLAAVRRTATGLKPHYAALVAALQAELRRASAAR